MSSKVLSILNESSNKRHNHHTVILFCWKKCFVKRERRRSTFITIVSWAGITLDWHTIWYYSRKHVWILHLRIFIFIYTCEQWIGVINTKPYISETTNTCLFKWVFYTRLNNTEMKFIKCIGYYLFRFWNKNASVLMQCFRFCKVFCLITNIMFSHFSILCYLSELSIQMSCYSASCT